MAKTNYSYAKRQQELKKQKKREEKLKKKLAKKEDSSDETQDQDVDLSESSQKNDINHISTD